MTKAALTANRLLALSGASALALIALQPDTAQADDCLLDRDDDGVVDAATDNDGGANSNDIDNRLACGTGAVASGSSSTAVGSGA